MSRFLNDQAKLVLLHESGTFGTVSGNGIWLGQVQSHTITENQNVIQTRYLGQANRNVGQFNNGPLDFEGTITLQPQDWRLLGFAMGSIATTSGTSQADNYRFDISEVNGGQRFNAFTSGTLNPWISFQLEESRTGNVANQNFMRTLKGCVVNSYTLNITQGEPLSVEVEFMAQSGSWFSGASTSVTAGSNRPYLWSDAILSLPTSTTQETVKSLSLSINNNFESPHYVNGSRVAQVQYPLNREYSVEVTQDLAFSNAGSLYNIYYQGGSLFNCELDINNTANTGSHRLTVYFSGCRIISMDVPVTQGEISETTYTFVPGSVSAIAHDRVIYVPWL